jgi:hypothetical protein
MWVGGVQQNFIYMARAFYLKWPGTVACCFSPTAFCFSPFLLSPWLALFGAGPVGHLTISIAVGAILMPWRNYISFVLLIEAVHLDGAEPVLQIFKLSQKTTFHRSKIWNLIFDGLREMIPSFDTNAKSTLAHLGRCTR